MSFYALGWSLRDLLESFFDSGLAAGLGYLVAAAQETSYSHRHSLYLDVWAPWAYLRHQISHFVFMLTLNFLVLLKDLAEAKQRMALALQELEHS